MELDDARIGEIKEKAAEIQNESGGFMEPGTKTKKRGKYKPRKTKVEAKESSAQPSGEGASEAPHVTIPTKQILMPALSAVSRAAGAYAGTPQAEMHPGEMDAMGDLLSALLDKYAPAALTKYGLEITCVMICGQYAYRVYSLKKVVDAQKAAQSPAPPTNTAAQVDEMQRMKMQDQAHEPVQAFPVVTTDGGIEVGH